METWADYGISEVHYDRNGQYIDKVKVHKDLGEEFGKHEEWARKDVLAKIDDGKTFVTILSNDDGWYEGEKVQPMSVGQRRFLRTDANDQANDNLGNLPEF
ncbi:DUF3892 domain-containing protein [Natronospira bacteriovora]|uniref:DUF3892 domain-containing protein n=1 Tax=Natronospira bacteriovora TaxID=3069753 RepID=A0ABU0W795_9GAMM|nr:DUF3892 domain-containing protein [Natronospira sp. AB-CW4]MDQ2069827.1 DUF3892 domain-containing protein [Natronospira sp. AB-CW4]